MILVLLKCEIILVPWNCPLLFVKLSPFKLDFWYQLLTFFMIALFLLIYRFLELESYRNDRKIIILSAPILFSPAVHGWPISTTWKNTLHFSFSSFRKGHILEFCFPFSARGFADVRGMIWSIGLLLIMYSGSNKVLKYLRRKFLLKKLLSIVWL